MVQTRCAALVLITLMAGQLGCRKGTDDVPAGSAGMGGDMSEPSGTTPPAGRSASPGNTMPAQRGGARTAPNGGDRPTANGGDASAQSGGAGTSPTGGPPTPSGGDTSAQTGGTRTSPTGGDTPTPNGGETSAQTGGAAATSSAGETDPTGVWWTEVETTGSETLPILDKLTGALIRFVMRVEVSGTAPNHNVTFDFCQLQTEWVDPADPNNITTIGFRPDAVAAFSEAVEVDLGGLSPGSEVPLPSLTFRGGVDEAGMDFDEDGDGNPAVTAWVRTLLGIEIEVYETITVSASLDLSAMDDDTLSGTLDFNADALILTSNNPIIFAGSVVTITPDSDAVPLTVRRLPGGGDCSALPSRISFTTVPPPPPALFPPPVPEPAAPAPAPPAPAL